MKGKQVKKKSIPTKSKQSTVEVVLLQKYQDVPKGAALNKLKKCGRVQQIKLTRVMAAADVERVIKHAFKHVALKQFMPLDVDTTGHYLSRSEEELDGQQAIEEVPFTYVRYVVEICIPYLVAVVYLGGGGWRAALGTLDHAPKTKE